MAEFLKNKNLDINSELFSDFFDISEIKYYDKIYIIDIEHEKEILKKLNPNNLVILSNKKEKNTINKNIPSFTSLSNLKKSDIFYIKEDFNLIYEQNLNEFLKEYKGIIITTNEGIDLLIDLNIIDNKIIKPKDKYLIIDKYGNVEEFNY